MKKLIKKHKLSFLLSGFALLFLLPQITFACTPKRADPWFTTALSFDNNVLPSGIELTQVDPIYEPHALINKGSIPLYVVRTNPTGSNSFPNSELPAGYEPLYKLVNNKVYYYSQDSFSKPPRPGYRQDDGGINNSAASQLKIDENVYVLEGESSNQIYKDDRPLDVVVPEPQKITILTFYKNAPFQINGKISYKLNEKYDPQAFVKGAQACSSLNQALRNSMWIPILFAVIIILAIGFLGFKLARKG